MIKIAIPSHNRLESLKECIKMLDGIGDITVYIGDQDYFDEVRKAGIKQAVKVPEYTNMSALRNQILGYYKEGEKILFVDDDITKIFKKKGTKLIQMDKGEITGLVKVGFEMCNNMGVKQRGVAPFKNSMYMKGKMLKNKFIIACFFGMIKSKLVFDELTTTKEDYDMSLQHIIYEGGNIRFDGVCSNNEYLKTKGGLQDRSGRDDIARTVTKYLEQKRGNLILRKSDTEISINPKALLPK